MAKSKPAEEKEKPKEKIKVQFAHCECGWSVSGDNLEGRAVAHSIMHKVQARG